MPDTIAVKWGGREVVLAQASRNGSWLADISPGLELHVFSAKDEWYADLLSERSGVDSAYGFESMQAAIDDIRAALRSIPDVHEWRGGAPDEPGVYAGRWRNVAKVECVHWSGTAWQTQTSFEPTCRPDEYFTARLG